MKDGTVYKGKIMIDTDKAILIGNPPFDPNSYLLKSEDIDKIIYENIIPTRRLTQTRLTLKDAERMFFVNQLSNQPAPSLWQHRAFACIRCWN